jgi:hypothetical protein
MGWATDGSGFESRNGKEFSLLHIVQMRSSAHQASNTMGNWEVSPGATRQGRETDHLPPTIIEAKKTWNYASTPPYVFMA